MIILKTRFVFKIVFLPTEAIIGVVHGLDLVRHTHRGVIVVIERKNHVPNIGIDGHRNVTIVDAIAIAIV